MGKLFRLSLGAALVALAAGIAPLRAETPKDGLVLADFIDDMISLDPAEVFGSRQPRSRPRSTIGWSPTRPTM
jgi:hypothetical protein